ncbi:TonB-dependent receptor [Sphingobium fuliginis]|uniref:TonB-dependent receptor n=1 Tax=Sphingobium fuliginis (strain ATCC 27551) TaxID=336203 RepID=UPI001431D835|nr:TonB-dependent receptor [Sphingobium fuliginis]
MRKPILCASPFVSLMALVLPFASQAKAQTGAATTASTLEPGNQSDDAVADIIVTAQKRGENVQNVPISVTALGASALTAASINRVTDLVRVAPGFETGRQASTAATRLSIRGIGGGGSTAVDPSVATFLDDVYIARSGSIVNGFFDVAQIEVLRGPQGTLFGRNASAGAISIHTATPSNHLEGFVTAQAGSFDAYRFEGAVNVPLADGLAVRVAGLASGHGGYAFTSFDQHRYSKESTRGGRITARWEPAGSGLSWTLRADFLNIGGDGKPQLEFLPETFTPTTLANYTARVGASRISDVVDPFDRRGRNREFGELRDRQWGLSSDASYELEGGSKVRLINSYRHWRFENPFGDILFIGANALDQLPTYDSRSESHELQFISPKGMVGGAFDFVAGLYYFHEDLSLRETYNLGPDWCGLIVPLANPGLVSTCLASPQQGADGRFTQNGKSYAAYGQGVLHLTEKFDLTGGARWTRDTKKGTFVQTVINPAFAFYRAAEPFKRLDYEASKPSYRVNLSYRPARDVLVFATYSTGYKAGGFNSGFSAQVPSTRSLRAETETNYEIGVKSQFFDRRVLLNATLFRDDIKGFQDRTFRGNGITVENAGDIRAQGIDAEFVVRPIAGLTASVTAEYLDSKFTSYPLAANLPGLPGTQDLTGTRPNYSPKLQGNAALQYDGKIGTTGWKFSVRGDVSFISDVNVGSSIDGNPQTIQQGYALLGARLSVDAPSALTLSVFGTNLADKNYCSFAAPNPLDNVLGLRGAGFTAIRCSVGLPREIGASVTYRF